MVIHTRQKLFLFGRYVAKARLFCEKSFVPITRAGVFKWENVTRLLRSRWQNGSQAFENEIANFASFFYLSIPKRDLDIKKTTPNVEVCAESFGAMLEY